MEENTLTNAQIDALIADTHTSTVWTDAEKYQLIQRYEAARPKEENTLASKEELDRVMPHIEAGFRPKPKPESEKSADEKQMDKFLDDVMRHI